MHTQAILSHFIYRILRSLFNLVQYVYYAIRGWNEQLFTKNNVEVCRILYRHKIMEGDMSSPTDFVWTHDHFTTGPSFLDDDHWALYTIDETFAYFLWMPRPVAEYTVNNAPFLYMKQFEVGLRLARCTLDTFCVLTRPLADNKGPVIYESSAARSGSTLMAQLLQASGKAFVLGEPDALTALTNLIDRDRISANKAYPIVHAIFKYLLRCQKEGEIYVIKPQSNCIRLVPFIKSVCPSVKHFFMFRKDTKRILISVEKVCRMGCSAETTWLWNYVSPEFACWLVNFGAFEYAFIKRFGPIKDCLDMAIFVHLSPYYEFFKNRALFDLPWVLYEDLIANPRLTLETVFDLCQIPLDRIDDALKVFNNDSQAGTILSQDKMKSIQVTELSNEKIIKMNKICNALNIPLLEF